MNIKYQLYKDICKLVDYLLKDDPCYKAGVKRDRLKILQEMLNSQEYTVAEAREVDVKESTKGNGFSEFKKRLEEFKK